MNLKNVSSPDKAMKRKPSGDGKGEVFVCGAALKKGDVFIIEGIWADAPLTSKTGVLKRYKVDEA